MNSIRMFWSTILKMILLKDAFLGPPNVSTLLQHHEKVVVVDLILMLTMMHSTHP